MLHVCMYVCIFSAIRPGRLADKLLQFAMSLPKGQTTEGDGDTFNLLG